MPDIFLILLLLNINKIAIKYLTTVKMHQIIIYLNPSNHLKLDYKNKEVNLLNLEQLLNKIQILYNSLKKELMI